MELEKIEYIEFGEVRVKWINGSFIRFKRLTVYVRDIIEFCEMEEGTFRLKVFAEPYYPSGLRDCTEPVEIFITMEDYLRNRFLDELNRRYL